MKFSANLGFLWNALPLPEAIRAAARAGFDAVECHWPYDQDPAAVKAALDGTGLPMLGLNTRRGNPGETGLAALQERAAEARAAVDEAIAYARAVGARNIHVMAGVADGAEALQAFLGTLGYATQQAEGLTILIEPLNRHDAPGYFLRTTGQARAIIETLDAPNLKMMFDCYHVQRTEGDVTTRLGELMPFIGHIQFAGVPERGRPDEGELDHAHVFRVISDLGWPHPLGAEYRPGGATEDSLGWMARFR